MKYEFKTISIFYFIITLGIFITTIGYLGLKVFGIMNSFIAILFVVFTFSISYLISYNLTLGKVQVTLTNKKIDYLWLQKPLLTFQNNESIDIENITSWKYQTEFQYSFFKIYNPADIITIMRLSNWSPEKDDFDNFLFAFKKRIERINKKRIIHKDKNKINENQNRKIKDKEVEFYNSKRAKVLFYVYVLTGLMGSFHLFNNWNNKQTNIGLMIYLLIGCSFYIHKYFIFKKGK